MSEWLMHSSAHAMHIVIVACSIAIMLSMCMPAGRIIIRIIVFVMSAVFMHMFMHVDMPSPVMVLAHIVHACSHAEQASIHSCIIVMSMPCMGMSFWCDSIICIAMFMVVSFQRTGGFPACYADHPDLSGGVSL
ncbi:MAG: hypothetical protein ABWX65_00785 [Mycetocola sp.]